MSLEYWILFYVINLIFWIWILFWGGAEFLEDTVLGMLFLGYIHIHTEVIKLAGWIILIFLTILFIVGIFSPDFRELGFLF